MPRRPAPAPDAAGPARPQGFTLLEVLAAVAVVGLTFTMLARWNIEGLRAEARAAGRLEASLVADRVLAEIEAGQLAGSAPQVGEQRSEQDGFEILVDVQPLQLALAEVPPEIAAARPETAVTTPAGPTLLAAPGSGQVTPLRHVRVTVRWDDGIVGDQVVRDTFVFDAVSVAGLLQGLAAQPGPEDAAGTPTEASPGGEEGR